MSGLNGQRYPTELANDSSQRNWFLVDVRTPGEFRSAHIIGSVNLPLGDLGAQLDSSREQCGIRNIAVICRTARRAKRAIEKLREHGIANTCVLEGGVVPWERAGLPLRRGAGGMSIENQERVAAGSLVLSGALLGFFISPAFYGLSGLACAGLLFAGFTDTCGMGMAHARMPWNRTSVDSLVPGDLGE